MEKIERENEPSITLINDDDIEMHKAISNALKTFKDFEIAFKDSENENFALKIRYDFKNKSEHIWVTNIQEVNNEYYGIIDNLPNTIASVNLGDKIKIDKEKISDWMYSKKGKLYGGFTIKVIRNKMSETEKKIFDKEFTLRIE